MGRLSNRVDVTVGAGVATGGASDVKTPGGLGDASAPISKNPEFDKDFKAANAGDKASLTGSAVSLKVEARNLGRVGGDNFIDAGIKGTHHFGDNASGNSLVVTGNFRRGYFFVGAEAGAKWISGGQKTPFEGTALQAALAGGLDMVVLDRVTARVGAGVQRTIGNLSNGASIDDTAFMVFVEGGINAVENGKAAWKVPSIDTGAPPPPTKCEDAADAFRIKGDADEFLNAINTQCKASPKDGFDAAVDQLKGFYLTPGTLPQYSEYLKELTFSIANTKGMTADATLELMEDIEDLWTRTTQKELAAVAKPHTVFINDLAPHLAGIAVKDQRLLKQLAGTYDKVIKGAEKLPAQENCKAKLDVLTTFYAQIFRKGGDATTQAQYRDRADKLVQDLVTAAQAEDKVTPRFLAGILNSLTAGAKNSKLLQPHKALLEGAAKTITDVGVQKTVLQNIKKATA